MQDSIFPVSDEWKQRAHIDAERYQAMYQQSVNEPEVFWAEQAEHFNWHKKWDRISRFNFDSPVFISWYEGAKTNLTENCIDRHLEKRAGQTAIIWEGDNPEESKHISYKELHIEVCKLANVLRDMGVQKGDRVTIYLPMIPEAAYAMLACARIGAVHSVVFGGFSAEALKGRLIDCESKFLITADEGMRGGKTVPLKANADEAVSGAACVEKVLVVKRTGGKIGWLPHDRWYHEAMEEASVDCPPESMDAEDPLFILYTSGSTGKPKGVLHTTAGYMVWAQMTHKYTFDYQDGEIYWCTADVGWVTGHTYIVYGPLLNGATTLMFEGVPNYPDHSRFWQVVDKHKVNTFYTAPTAIRALMREGDEPVKQTSRESLKLLGTVGEPINPEAWLWYHKVVGQGRCPIVDTWWQTETGGHMLTPLPGATDLKPGAAMQPFFGVQPVILNEKGEELSGAAEGMFCVKASWPGQMRTVYGDHKRFEETYFNQYPGYYFTGDGARRDEDGDYWITGRIDDVLNISGHRIGTAEVESALVAHKAVAEAAVVGFPHDIKGQGLYCYVTLNAGESTDAEIEQALKQWVRKEIGPIATPDTLHFTAGLPKTRSGKIMRRILRKIAEGEYEDLGDTSTLTNPEVVESLIKNRKTAA